MGVARNFSGGTNSFPIQPYPVPQIVFFDCLQVVSLQNEVDSLESPFAASCPDGAAIDFLYNSLLKTLRIN